MTNDQIRAIVGDLVLYIDSRQPQWWSRESGDAHARLVRFSKGWSDGDSYSDAIPTRQPETGPDQGAG